MLLRSIDMSSFCPSGKQRRQHELCDHGLQTGAVPVLWGHPAVRGWIWKPRALRGQHVPVWRDKEAYVEASVLIP